METLAIQHVQKIFAQAKPIIKIHGVGGSRWKRNVAKGGRIGPWLQGDYNIMNETAWNEKVRACTLCKAMMGTSGMLVFHATV